MSRVTAAVAALVLLSGCGTARPPEDGAPTLPRLPFDTTADPPVEEEFLAPNLILRPGSVVTKLRVVVAKAEDEEPLAGATVELTPRGHVAREGTTGEDGSVVFDGLPRVDVSISVRAPGRAEERIATRNGGLRGEEVNPGDPDSPAFRDLSFHLARALAVDAVVLSAADRQPIPGARTEVIRGGSLPDAHEYPYDEDPRLEAVTDGAGRFTVFPVPEGAIVTFVARHSDFVPTSLAIRTPPAGPVEILMEPAATIRGTVFGPDGAPFSGALVRAAPFVWNKSDQEEDTRALRFPLEVGPFDRFEGDHGGAAVSGEDGSFEIRCLEPGHRHRVFAFVGEALRSPLEDLRTTSAGGSARCELRLRPLAKVSVAVEDPAGEPVYYARVALAPPEGPWPEEERRGPQEDGIYRFEGVMPGTYRLRIVAEGLEASETTLVVPEEGKSAVTVRLGAGLALEGTLVDDTGRPLEDAHVTAWPLDDEGERRRWGKGWDRLRSVRTDSNGRFRFEGLPAVRHRVSPGTDATSKYRFFFPVIVDPPLADLRLVSKRHVEVVLSVSVPPGRELPKSVQVSGSSTDDGGQKMNGGSVSSLEGTMARCTGLHAGHVELTIRAAGFAPAHRTFDAAPGQIVDLGDVALDPGESLRGRVVDSMGRPVVGAAIANHWTSWESTRTDSEGRFTIHHLPAGEVTVWAYSPDFLQGSMKVSAGATTEEFVLPLEKGALVKGTIWGEDGIPRRGQVRFTRPGTAVEDGDEWAFADEDGRFDIRLPVGSWIAAARVGIWAGVGRFLERESESRSLTLAEGTETAIDFTVPVR